MGAYYSLREDDPSAIRNRTKLKGKREPIRGRFIIDVLERNERDKMEATDPWRKADFDPGDFIQVEQRPTSEDPADVFVGVVIGIHRRGLGTKVRLLCKFDNMPIEYLIPVYSPLVTNMFVRKKSEWRNRQRKLVKLRQHYNQLSFPAPLIEGKHAK